MIKLEKQIITQAFKGDRHKGVDLRCINDKRVNMPVIAPEKMQLLRNGKDGYGNYFMVCKPLDSDYDELKFIHIDRVFFDKDQIFPKGMELTFCMIGGNSNSLHLHFEVWKDGNAIDPVEYFYNRGIEYDFK